MIQWWYNGPLSPNGELIWGAPIEWLMVAVLVVAIALFLTVRREGSGRGLEAVSLFVAMGAVLWGLADPIWYESGGRTEPGRTVVLIDGSRSMAVEQERMNLAMAALDEIGPERDVFTFGESVKAGLPLGWTESGSNIGGALEAIGDRYLGQSLRSIVLVTDGIDRGGLRDRLSALDDAQLPELPGPLTVVQVGQSITGIDSSVTAIQTGGFAFLRTPFPLTALVEGRPKSDLTVTLKREGRLVDTQRVSLDQNGQGEARFEVTPNAVGRFVWEVSVPDGGFDAVPGNNTHSVVIRVVRDRTRVLQVCGSPSYDQKFLRLFLKEDPSVDLVSFFILRTHEDFASGWYPDELSLIAFPYARLFTEQLDTFDVVIFQNFDFKPYFERDPDGLLRNIVSFVRGGGAMVMIGGDRSFDLGEYAGTPIEGILPVKLGVKGELASEAAFRPVLPIRGNQHPVTRIAGTVEDSEAAWARLPKLDGMNRNRGLSDGAAALLTHPDLTAAGAPMPVLAVKEIGEGRTMALMTDASWRWSFSEAATGRGNQAYLRFWKGALRWLVADPDDRRVVVQPSTENVLLGQEIRLSTTVRDAGFNAIEGERFTGVVTAPDGSQVPISGVTDGTGIGVSVIKAGVAGAHRVRVEAGDHGAAETVFSVVTRDPELAEVSADRSFLERLAAAYGDQGAYRAPGADLDPLVDSEAVRVIDEQRSVSLASMPILALIFGVFAGLAWWTRRRNGGR